MVTGAAAPTGNMTIGQLARRAGVGVQTVRYYERRHLLPAAPRRSSGYREFTPAALHRLQFIRRAQELGFTLAEIADLLALRLDPHTTAEDIKGKAEGKIREINRRIADLERIKGALAHLAGRCRGHGPTGDCPLLEALGQLEESGFAPALSASGGKPKPDEESDHVNYRA